MRGYISFPKIAQVIRDKAIVIHSCLGLVFMPSLRPQHEPDPDTTISNGPVLSELAVTPIRNGGNFIFGNQRYVELLHLQY